MANNIKRILELLNISQSYIAQKLNISRQTLNYNLNTEEPKKYNKAIAHELGISIEYITKDELTTQDLINIQSMHNDKNTRKILTEEMGKNSNNGFHEIASKMMYDMANYSGTYEKEKLVDDIRVLLSNCTPYMITGNYGEEYEMLRHFVDILNNKDGIENKLLKAMFYTFRKEKTEWAYYPNILTKEQKEEFYDVFCLFVEKCDKENKKQFSFWRK